MIQSSEFASMLAAQEDTRRLPLGKTAPAVGTTVTGVAVLTEREDKTTKHGKPYSRITLRNATGGDSLNVWAEHQEAMAGLTAGTPVQVALTRVAGRNGEVNGCSAPSSGCRTTTLSRARHSRRGGCHGRCSRPAWLGCSTCCAPMPERCSSSSWTRR